jgi:hypothetical protein
MRECLWLVRNGIPFDVAFGVDDAKRTAWAITFSEFESGKTFNWHSMEFEDPK